MAQRIRGHDWTATPLGPVGGWSERLKAVVDLLLVQGFPMVALWGSELVQIYNDGYRALMGSKHPEGLGQPTRLCWPEVWHINEPIYHRVWAGETLTFEDRLYPIARHGPLEDAWFTLTYAPLRGAMGVVTGVLVTVVETTMQHLAETRRDQVEAELRASEARFRALATTGSYAVYRMSPDWSEMRQLDGRGFIADTQAPSWSWLETYIHPNDQSHVLAAIQEAIRARHLFELEHRVLRADGTLGWTLSRAVPLLDEAGEITEWFGAASDVTGRKLAEEALRAAEALRVAEAQILIAELQHRSRNLLTVVSGIADQTVATSGTLEEFGARFEQRLAALGRVQGLLSREMVPNVTADELVRLEFAAHGVDNPNNDRVRLAGPQTVLPAHAVQLLALALHELLTNAVKHGALGQPQGRLEVYWNERRELGTDAARLRLDWIESGINVTEVALRRGFGLDLIEFTLPYELGGETRLEFAPDGVRCAIELPLDDGR